jgi:hypothetical protein
MNSNHSKTQPIDKNQYMNMNYTGFAFNLGQVNKIKPKQLRKLDIIHLIRTNNIPELKSVLYDLSQENFKENDYFEFQKDELKLIKTYQMMMQYMMNSINQLEEKNQKLNEFIEKQLDYNEAAEQVIEKQNKKIRNQKEEIDTITGNCENMEFLIRKLGLEQKIKELGIKPSNNYMNEEEFEQFREKMINQNKNLEGENKFP